MDKLMLYCIKHEKTFRAEQGVCGLGHTDFYVNLNFEVDIDFCCFPLGFAFSPPPDPVFYMGIDEIALDEPCVEDLEAADQGAEEFMLALELAGG